MSGITTGVGIFSGIDTGSLINQLIQVASRPKVLAQQRIVQLQAQQAAFLDLTSRLNSLKTAASKFNIDKVFQTARATSSNPQALAASASSGATPGAYSFIIDRVVSTQQLLSRGFADRDASSIGARRFIIEPAQGRLDRDVPLSELNGGMGVSRGRIVITDSTGSSVTVDLSRTGTVGEVLEAINTAGNGRFSARVQGDRFVITDTAGGAGTLTVGNAAGSTTATSLGIEGAASTSGSGGSLTGASVYRLGGGTALQSLNDGNGIRLNTAIGSSTPDFSITTRDGSVISIDLGNIYDAEGKLTASAPSTLQGVIDRINEQSEGKVTASIGPDGVGLRLVDNTAGPGTFAVTDDPLSGAATDLGIARSADGGGGVIDGARILAGLNSTLVSNLLGGRGLDDGEITLTARDGSAFSFTLPTGDSVSDLLDAFADATGGRIVAALDSTGTGIVLTDTTGGTGNLIVGGAAATALGLETDPAGVASSTLRSDRLHHRYVAASTLLSSLNGGVGLGAGVIEITNSSGARTRINIGDSVRTVGDLIAQINGANTGVTARINDTGDGILLEDSADPPGGQKIQVRDASGTIARTLNLAGEAAGDGEDNVINGSFERIIELDDADTLDDLVQKINNAGAGVRASIINDGTGAAPFRLSLTSARSGAAGRFTIDAGDLDLGLQTISDGTDARIFYGSADAARGILLSSSSNIFDGVIPGVRIDALGVSDSPVTVTVSRDTDAIIKAVQDFVAAFNDVIGRINNVTSYDADTQRRGALLGDSTVQQLRASLFSTLDAPAQGVSGTFQYLSQVGIRIGSGGAISLDAEQLRTALEQDPQGVADLFAAKTPVPPRENPDPNADPPPLEYSSLGVAEQMVRLIDRYVNTADGILRRRNETYDAQIRTQNERIAAIDAKLATQRLILERQFVAMERAIGQMQSQSGALISLAGLVANLR